MRKLWVRHIMERRFKQECCVLIIMNWNVLIARMFSVNFMFWLYKFCNQQKIKEHISSFSIIVSTSHIFYTCHCCWLTEVNCFLKWSANCGEHLIGHYTVKRTSDISILRGALQSAKSTGHTFDTSFCYNLHWISYRKGCSTWHELWGNGNLNKLTKCLC